MELQHERDPWSTLLDLTRLMAGAHDARELAELITRRLVADELASGVGVWVRADDELTCLARQGFAQPPSLARIHRFVESGGPALIEQIGAPGAIGAAGALAYLPLTAAREPIGALVLEATERGMQRDRPMFEVIAAHIGLALQNLRAREQPRRAAAQSPAERAWDEFLSHAAHEIKNPLASIKGYADLLMRRAAKQPGDPYHKGLTIISQQVGRTTAVLDQLSDLARVGADRLRLDQREVDLAALAREAVDASQATTDQHQITLDHDSAGLRVSCDPERIGQVIGMMLSNALKFSPRGGPIVVAVRRAGGNGHGSPRGEAIVSVSDEGIGVPEGERERVFERFFRGSNVAGAYRGLGISLFIARAIVERHGGRIWLESAPEQGTTAYLALPLQ